MTVWGEDGEGTKMTLGKKCDDLRGPVGLDLFLLRPDQHGLLRQQTLLEIHASVKCPHLELDAFPDQGIGGEILGRFFGSRTRDRFFEDVVYVVSTGQIGTVLPGERNSLRQQHTFYQHDPHSITR